MIYRSTLEHPKYEYAFYCRVKNGKPYIIPTKEMTDMVEVNQFIKEIEAKHEKLNTAYYIDNDFYHNRYSESEKGTYYKVLRRPISDWEVVQEEKTSKKSCNPKSSIIYLK